MRIQHLGATIAPSSLIPPLPPYSLLYTPSHFPFLPPTTFARTTCCGTAQECKHEAHALESGGADHLPTRCFYLAGFQDVDLLLVHGVPVLLQKSLALVFHLGGKGRSPEGEVQQQRDKVLCPTTPLLLELT